ncbi:hypothetical protein CHUAL_002700 [Chamberlinius hualienensis]
MVFLKMAAAFRFKCFTVSIIEIWCYLHLINLCIAQLNRPPDFLADGDLSWLSVKEDTPIGSSVYTLMANDPDGRNLSYNIISNYFSVDKRSGVLTLIKSLDREDRDSIEVYISVTDEEFHGVPAKTVELKRQITVQDVNDNIPVFTNATYTILVEEETPVGTIISDGIIVTDEDVGNNAEVSLHCFNLINPVACDKFNIEAELISPGRYKGLVRLKKNLDYEENSIYILTVKAEDASPKHSQLMNLIVEVIDNPDQPPVFLNGPYFWAFGGNETEKFEVIVEDGDRGRPRQLDIKLLDSQELMSFSSTSNDKLQYTISLSVADDKSDLLQQQNGGFYEFFIKATEMEDGRLTSISSEISVTVYYIDGAFNSPKWSSQNCRIEITKENLTDLNFKDCNLYLFSDGKTEVELISSDDSSELFDFEFQKVKGLSAVNFFLKNESVDYSQQYEFQLIASDNRFGLTTETNIEVDVKIDIYYSSISFQHQQYIINVSESLPPKSFIYKLTVNEDYSDLTVSYSLNGFGSQWFNVDSKNGSLYLSECSSSSSSSSCLDYERFSELSLIYTANNSLGRQAATQVLIRIIDENDNSPQFINSEIRATFSLKTNSFDPPLKLQAVDIDSSYGGNNQITYKIFQTDPETEAFNVDQFGEIKLNRSSLLINDYNKQFKVHVVAEDLGNPSLSSETFVLVNIEREVEGILFFTQSFYNSTIAETDREGKEVLQVAVVDPQTVSENIIFRIKSGSFDNFIIDSRTGSLTIAPDALLDLEKSPKSYHLQLEAINLDSLKNQTATAIVNIKVEDVNNKVPKFLQRFYIYNISEDENEKKDSALINVKATDADANSFIHYYLIDILFARDENGLMVSSDAITNLKKDIKIDELNGSIIFEKTFNRFAFSIICIRFGARDLNAPENQNENDDQSTEVQVFLLVKRQTDHYPVFPHPWSIQTPQLFFSIPEEASIGSKLFTLTAKCLDNQFNVTYEIINDEFNYFKIHKPTGVVILEKRLDFESLPEDNKRISFITKAINNNNGQQFSSTATVLVDIVDINDNSPIFPNDTYWRTIPESIKDSEVVLVMNATDEDRQHGFGDIRFTLTEDSDSNAFQIDSLTGVLTVANEKMLDRELKSVYNLKVTGTDNPEGIENHRQSFVLIVVELEDVNDNAPVFLEPLYQAIFPETVAPEFVIRQIEATDADLGDNGRISYSLNDNSQLKGFVDVNESNGILFVKKALSGKGRSEPYKLGITATDYGKPSFSSTTHILLFITDISTNDGVPIFIKPLSGDVVNLPENSAAGTVITILEVANSDISKVGSGNFRFSFLGDNLPDSNERHFAIDPVKGILSSRYPLDREIQTNYTVTIIVKDFENSLNLNSLSLIINIVDADDHFPVFQRPKNSHPILMEVNEEVPLDTIVGYVQAFDNDIDDNSNIEYDIINSSEEDLVFGIKTEDNKGLIFVSKQIDCEIKDNYLLTIEARRYESEDLRKGKAIHMTSNSGLLTDNSEKPRHKIYDPSIMNLVQVKIYIKDIDDHKPYFKHGNSTTWIKLSAKPGDIVFRFRAQDDDFTRFSILYKVVQSYFTVYESKKEPAQVFIVDEDSGILRLRRSLKSYENGYFEVIVEATCNNRTAVSKLTIYILQNRQLLKLVFNKPLVEIKNDLTKLKKNLQEKLLAEALISADILDTPYLTQETTVNYSSLCFQVVSKDEKPSENYVENILDSLNNIAFDTIYDQFGIQKVEKCEIEETLYTLNWADITVLVIAALIVVISTICCIVICNLYKRYKRKLQQRAGQFIQYHSDNNSNYGYATVNNQRINDWQKRGSPLSSLPR